MKRRNILPYTLRIGMRFDVDVSDWSEGQRLMSPLFDDPALRPERAASFEDVKRGTGVALDGLDALEEVWGLAATLTGGGVPRAFSAETGWRRWKAPASTGSISFAMKDDRGRTVPGLLLIETRNARRVGPEMVALFDHLCDYLKPSAALLHPYVKDRPQMELTSPVARRAASDFALGAPWTLISVGDTNRRVEGASDLGWCGVVPQDRIRDRGMLDGVCDVREFGDTVRMRFGTDPSLAITAPQEFVRRRQVAKRAVLPDTFLVPENAGTS